MTYNVRKTDSSKDTIPVGNGTQNNDTDLNLFGYVRLEYGEELNENIIRLLENFAAPRNNVTGTALSRFKSPIPDLTNVNDTLASPIEGQIWYENILKRPYIYQGSEFNPIGVNGDYAANWGVLRHGEYLPRPVSTKTGYQFPYEECIWVVAPYNINSAYDYFSCTTNSSARITSQIRTSDTSALVNSYANYLIIGIRGNRNNGVYVTPVAPTPTPTPTPSVTPTITPTNTPPPSSGATPTPTPTPTITPTPSDVGAFRIETYDSNDFSPFDDRLSDVYASCFTASYTSTADTGYLDCANTFGDCLIGSCSPDAGPDFYRPVFTVKVIGGTPPYDVRLIDITGTYAVGSECIYFNTYPLSSFPVAGPLMTGVISTSGGILTDFPVLYGKCGDSALYVSGTFTIEVEDATATVITEVCTWSVLREIT